MNDNGLVKKIKRYERKILIPRVSSTWCYENNKRYRTIDHNYLQTVGCGCCSDEVYVNPEKRTTVEIFDWLLASHEYILNNLKKHRFKFK